MLTKTTCTVVMLGFTAHTTRTGKLGDLRDPRSFVLSIRVKLSHVGLVGWLAGWLVCWLAGRLVGWLAGWLVGLLAGWLAGWLVGWLPGWLAGLGETRLGRLF